MDRKNEELYSRRIKHFEQELEVVNEVLGSCAFRYVQKIFLSWTGVLVPVHFGFLRSQKQVSPLVLEFRQACKKKRPFAKKPLVASRNVSCFQARIYLVCAIQERVASKLITSRSS